ncbi:ribosomal RNA small subunit methyltransferase A [bacterium]|nr:ribosomal RNA small subunit methyltransferase A [bacterium]
MEFKSSKKILSEESLTPKKRFGQHFLTDKNILQKISNSIEINKDDIVIEFGPGAGALTQYLIDKTDNFYAVDFDKDMVTLFEKEFVPRGGTIFWGDASKFSFNEIYEKHRKEIILVGNLPYNVSSQIIFNVMEQINQVKSALFMVQKEVALRLTEKKDSKNYSILTVLTDLHFKKKILFDVKRNCFFPPPNVDSSIVYMQKIDEFSKILCDEKLLKSVVKAAFSQRRKKVRNTLKEYLKYFSENETPFSSDLRAEDIGIDEYIEFTNTLYQKLKDSNNEIPL